MQMKNKLRKQEIEPRYKLIENQKQLELELELYTSCVALWIGLVDIIITLKLNKTNNNMEKPGAWRLND